MSTNIEPSVIDDDLLRKAVNEQIPPEIAEIARKEGVDYSEVTSIRLDYKNILKIDNLWVLQNLTKLQLDNNIIEKIENINFLTNLQWLDLSFNNITVIEGLDGLTKLTDLTLYNNRISKIENLDDLVNLQIFSIGNNNISTLDNLAYLTKFEHLRVLNAAGNPMSKNPNYKHYALAYLKGLRYLDYRLVDDESVKTAREKFMDELIALEEEGKITNAKKEAARKAREQDALYTEAHIKGIDNLFNNMFEDDPDFKRLLPLARQQIFEQREDYRAKFMTLIKEFTTTALRKQEEKKAETELFTNCLNAAKSEADAECIARLNYYNHTKKQTLREVQGIRDTKEKDARLKTLKDETTTLVEFFMSQEMQLVEAFEDVIKEFERQFTEICNSINENGQAAFARIRELENEFHERYTEIIMSAFDRLSKSDIDELEEEIRDIISDKDALVNNVNGSHDFRISKIDHQEDLLTSGVNAELERVIAKTQADEIQRNRERVCEIATFRDKCYADIDAVEDKI